MTVVHLLLPLDRLFISAPRLGVCYFFVVDSVSMSLHLSVTLLLQIASSVVVFRWNRAIFWPSVLHVALYKTCFLQFLIWARIPKIDSQKFGTKSPISRLVWQIDRRCLGLLGGFRGWPIQRNHRKCCGADPCCHGNEIFKQILAIFAQNFP